MVGGAGVGGVVVDRAEVLLGGPRPLEQVVGQHVPGEAHAAEHLDRRGGVLDRGVGGKEIGAGRRPGGVGAVRRSDEHTSELQSLMRISYAVFCLKNKMEY